MPRTRFSSENRPADTTRFPRLKLEKDEKKRVVVIENEPFFEYTHRLEMPQIDERGQAVMTEKKRQDGSTYPVNAMDFVSSPLCLGKIEVLEEKGVDEDTCPACKVARQSNEVKPPTPRYASHVLVYGTKPGSFEIVEPFTVTCIVWLYSARRFNTLIDIREEHELEVLSSRDLLLGPCVNKEYQNFEIRVGGKAEWAGSKDRMAIAKQALESNRLSEEQITEMLGKKVELSWMLEDLKKIHLRWQRIDNGPSEAASETERGAESASLDQGLAGLLDESSSEETPSDSDTDEKVTVPEKGEELDFEAFAGLLDEDSK